MTDSEFITAQTDERNLGFKRRSEPRRLSDAIPFRRARQPDRNRRAGCPPAAHGADAGGRSAYPRNTVVVGAARVQGERLGVDITSLEYQDDHPRRAGRFRQRRQEGIFIQLDEVVRPRGGGQHGGVAQQHQHLHRRGSAARLRPRQRLIQGTSQYIAKMRTVKVHLKAGYKVMLYQPES